MDEKDKNKIPVLSVKAIKGVSDYRRATLGQEISSGKFGEQNAIHHGFRRTGDDFNVNPAGLVAVASSNSTSASSSWRGSGDSVDQGPEIYSPLWLTGNLSLPRDRATVNAWSRSFFALNPIVQNAISLHSTYPISKLNIKCKDPKAELFFQEMSEELDLMNICVQAAQEYWILGETFPYAQYDETSGKWSRITLQNPDYITVQQSNVSDDPIISLRPDEQIKKIVTSNRPSDIQQRQKLSREVVEAIKRGENIPLSNFNISHLARRISPYEVRGTGLIVPCFRALMHFDIIREAELVQNQSLINPWLLVKIGGTDYKPDPAVIESFRQKLEHATFNRDFKLITHDQVDITNISRNNGVMDTTARVQQLIKEIYIGLMVPSVLMDGGSDTTYANGGVALDVLRQRYMQFRNKLALWLRRKIFAPIAELHGFCTYKDGKKVLTVPEVDWNYMSLFDAGDHIASLKELTGNQDKRVSTQSLMRSLGLDYEDEVRKMRQEMIDNSILEREKAALAALPLAKIRGIGPNDEIEEEKENLAGMPGVDQAGGEEMGGLPGVPPPPPDLAAS